MRVFAKKEVLEILQIKTIKNLINSHLNTYKYPKILATVPPLWFPSKVLMGPRFPSNF